MTKKPSWAKNELIQKATITKSGIELTISKKRFFIANTILLLMTTTADLDEFIDIYFMSEEVKKAIIR